MRKHPVHFRREEVQDVMQRFKSSESCSLVGVGSVGKSNLLHHLTDTDVHAHYLGEVRASQLITIVIDPNLLGPTDESSIQFKCWAGYELLMHRLFLALHPFDMLGEDAKSFSGTYRKLQDGTNPLFEYMGLRYFELGLEYFFRRDFQVVFLLDEFEELLRSMPVKFFQTLRGLRDRHKKKFSFLTFSREPIPVLVKKMGIDDLGIEPFTELFTDNLFFVGPYNREDAYAMAQSLADRNPNVHYTNDAINFLLHATGQYAGILRAGFRALEMLGDIGPADLNNMNLIERLARRPRVHSECSVIWKSLTDAERAVLFAVASRRPEEIDDESERAISLLVQKRLLRVNHQIQLLQIEPPVFNVFVKSLL